MTKKTDILILGGGAAGFFAACAAAERGPDFSVTVAEKSAKFLSKVKVSGGGRCNVTCSEEDPEELQHYYPRGGKFLRKLFYRFGPKEVKNWFKTRGVKLKTETDGRVFPVTDSSQTIINCLMHEASEKNISLLTGMDAVKIEPSEKGFTVRFRNGEAIETRKLIVATGGSPKSEGLIWLQDLGHKTVSPVPSLFTFNSPDHPICQLQGVSVSGARIRIAGTKFEFSGPLLITHWGISGPAVLKLSAFAARELAEKNYTFTALINWTAQTRPEWERFLENNLTENPKKKIGNLTPVSVPGSLWRFILHEAGINPDTPAAGIGKKSLNRLLELCFDFPLPIQGKTTFKEEFVTAGGVSLADIHAESMESRKVPGMYFAGEIVDLDGITGGFNFQAAWTTGYLAGRHAAETLLDEA
jgi:predicted Rossmann fold flavoprotein